MLDKYKFEIFLDKLTPKIKNKDLPITTQKEAEEMMLPFEERRKLYLKEK